MLEVETARHVIRDFHMLPVNVNHEPQTDHALIHRSSGACGYAHVLYMLVNATEGWLLTQAHH